MKRNSIFTIVGLLIFLLLCLVPSGQAQQATPLSQSPGMPWQLGLYWNFTASSGATGGFNTTSYSYWRIWWKVTGTISGCSISFDSITNGTPTIGGIISAPTIGSCASSGSYVTTSATVPATMGQLTPTITGTGTVTVAVLGYTDNPAAGGSIGGSVSVTSLPSTPAGSNTIGNVNIANVTAVTGPTNITSTQAVAVTVGGASEVQITVTNIWTGTLQGKFSGDGTNYVNALVHPTNPPGPWQSTITANGTYSALVAAGNSFEVVGNTVATGTATVTVSASPATGDVLASGLNTPADAASAPADAIHVQSWPMGWNGTSFDRLRTAGIGNVVASTGLLALATYCQYLSSLPADTNATFSSLQCDSSGRLLVTPSSMMSGTTPGTAPAGTDIIGCIYNGTSPPTPSSGQTLPCQTGPSGQMYIAGDPSSNSVGALSAANAQSSITTAVVLKASTGNLYGFSVYNGAASICYLQFINASTGPTLGTNALFSFPIPATSTLNFAPGTYALANFTTGISAGLSTTYNGSTTCGTAGSLTPFYK
jgi:hypothetical protein